MASDGSIKITTELDSKAAEKALSKFSSVAKTGLKGVTVAVGAVSTALTGAAGYAINTGIDFESAFAGGSGDLERFNQIYGDRIFNISVFSITTGRTVGAVIQDVTQSELHREKVAEKAREVIRKNVTTVQKIAQYLGEHMAETEIILREVAGSYSEIKDKKDGDGK